MPVLTTEKSQKSEEKSGSVQFFSGPEPAYDATESSNLKHISTGCVKDAGNLQKVRRLMKGFGLRLTASYPRLMPRTDQEFSELRSNLVNHFGLEDRPDVWLTVCGQIAGQPITTRRISYKRLATAGSRLDINALVKKQKDIEIGKLHARLEEIARQMKDEETKSTVPEQALDIQGDVQALPSTSEGMVQPTLSQDGFY